MKSRKADEAIGIISSIIVSQEIEKVGKAVNTTKQLGQRPMKSLQRRVLRFLRPSITAMKHSGQRVTS
jgi:hypothetical protein